MASADPRPSKLHLLRWGLLVGGAALLAALVKEVGFSNVVRTMVNAGPYMAPIVLLDASWFIGESISHRILLEDDAAKISWRVFMRTSFTSYAVLVLLPVGRMSAEVARAASYSRHISGQSAAAAAANVQAISLIANMLVSVPCALAVASAIGVHEMLTWFVVGNCVVTGVAGLGLLLIARRSRLGVRLVKWLPKLADTAGSFQHALRVRRATLVRSVLMSFTARLAQTVQYGLILAAVGGHLTIGSAFFTQGVHLVSAAVGDLVPGHVGVMEGAYRLSAEYFGFGDESFRALSIALVARASMVILATVTLLVLGLTRSHSPKTA